MRTGGDAVLKLIDALLLLWSPNFSTANLLTQLHKKAFADRRTPSRLSRDEAEECASGLQMVGGIDKERKAERTEPHAFMWCRCMRCWECVASVRLRQSSMQTCTFVYVCTPLTVNTTQQGGKMHRKRLILSHMGPLDFLQVSVPSMHKCAERFETRTLITGGGFILPKAL